MRYLSWLLAVVVILSGCAKGPAPVPVKAAPADPATAPWSEVVAQARDHEVSIYMWGGSDSINTWMDTYVSGQVKAKYGVTLKRVPVAATADAINKLLGEKQAGRTTGSADLVWINGENFKAARQGDLLWGPFAERLPSFTAYYDTKAPDVASDFGYPVEGYEVPWGKAQFVMTYDSAKVPNPPKSFAELAAWVKAHPGRFTYPAPSTDFTGSAFLRMALYETTGGYQHYLGAYDQAKLEAKWQKTFDYLNGLRPYLWRQGTTYPENLAKLDQLYADGEVWMSMHYDPSAAANLIAKGTYPATTRTFLFDAGTIANTHFLAVPFNAPNKAGAMVVADFLLSPEAQLSKFDPKNWGDFPAFDPAKAPAGVKDGLTKIDLGPAVLPPAVLAQHRVPEIEADYLKHLQDGWTRYVAQAK
ncbi:MAG TPA: ABC transporter substrate-binding protein [Symbiobacteriaceae bacterium]|jgi:putative spermidine/putrescine transport system substrate-binding protein